MNTTVVIFGASGDLTRRKLIPALLNAYCKGRMPEKFNIVGVSRSKYSHEDFRERLRENVKEFAPRVYEDKKWDDFAANVWYNSGNATELDSYQQLDAFLKEKEGERANRLYYFSTAPSLYVPTIQNLGAANMVDESEGWRRVVVEKPFGTDLSSAQDLNAIIHDVLEENQVFRIDHYLGKETAQNLLYFRFANTIFEPIWNRNYIDNVQITVAETVDVGHRADYYDKSGVLRDMFQNHLLQLLSLVAQEPPASMEANALRDEKVKLLRSVRPVDLKNTVRSQYNGYRGTEGVEENSETPTFAALKVFIDNWRWQGVPFYLRSGKAMPRKTSEIIIQFKEPPHRLFNVPEDSGFITPNALAICIQPDEGINLKFETKVPDSLQEMRSVKMGFAYNTYFGDEPLPDAYERLILDALKGDATLFTRSDGIEQAWRIIDPIIEGWKTEHIPKLSFYAKNTWGPVEADVLLGLNGRRWLLECGAS